MAVVFDTALLPYADRIEATVSAMQDQSVPSTVILNETGAVRCRMDVWSYGRATIFQAEMTGFRLRRTERQIRSSPGEQLGIALHRNCIGRQEQHGVQREVRPGALMITDHNAPYDYELAGPGVPFCLNVPVEELGLPREVVWAASERLAKSPLHNMVVDHITELTCKADELAASEVAAQLGETSIDLVRALIASAYDAEYARGTMVGVLLPRIRGYIRLHLNDPDLSPTSIARAHGITVGKLFQLFADAGMSPEQWIITSRLEGAHDDLARAETAHQPVAAIARRWGITNPSYFSRRFREMYGISPRAWRVLAASRTGERAGNGLL
ncbi:MULTISPECIES: helix-turn-helix domain-containing protein [unclassified Gordonia (in: high G+C Gram-positive bacteria)]|uniref:helix-turn-helix domain-containing protein n=1 Tax=unclassified Gordonia (in: high G+C Gram-positive bacteria) TaxID=2657482 RepID=UPI00071C39C0|nr:MULTISPECIES: helix-turn-helix domain-containing protein [unclassified Gordonia (in: high G+C Gram-positive bacteria)]KSU54508.1 hypothetical protein AS181_21175 [Gordonia sp. SGD-V-85]MBR7193249.1 helix-turn-helix domain-containing protein [Gordonia sp. SCSIO 19800]SCC53943.1 AraC-type DNA-binding protein [Gordonia sp. v-85]